MSPSENVIADFASAFTTPIYALPLDAFRVLAGLVSFCYFARTLLETSDFSSPDGLIDHRLSHRLLPPTRLSFFQSSIPVGMFRPIFALACLASASVAVGYQVKPAAAFLFLVAVSTYRWNMLVTYVDDAFMHLVLFWLILLPIGRTLNLYDWLRGSPAFEAWAGVTVPGGTTRLFLINLGIAYFVAGVYKWTSPMWRNGSALYAILKLPIAFSPHHLKPRHLPLLRIINYAALAIEPFFPLVFVLPPSSVTKWVVLAGLVGFHLGIVATLKIPFANLAMLGAIPIVLHDEIMIGLLGRPSPLRNTALGGIGLAELVGLALVSGISLMLFLEIRFVGRLTSMKGRRNSICMALWWVGIAQSYRLFDWIDLRNYHVRYEVFESVLAGSSHAIDPAGVFPRSIRHLLLQSYLHGNVWVQIDPPGLRELRRAILERYAHRYARRRGNTGTIEVFAIRQRITSDNLALERGVRRPLLRFYCAGGEPVFEYLCVNPEDEYFGAPGVVELEPVATINPPCEVNECAEA